jgi:hypothetical protein
MRELTEHALNRSKYKKYILDEPKDRVVNNSYNLLDFINSTARLIISIIY